MTHRVKTTSLLLIILLLAGPASLNLQAQQFQNQSRSMNIEMSRDFDQFFFVDELGLQLTLARFYESFLDIETYRLGTGDLLGLALEGNVSGMIRGLRVNSHGSVLIPKVGVVEVEDLLFHDAEVRINEKIHEKLPDTRSKLILEQPRAIQIHVVGNIPYSGPQLVYAQTRLDQAIYRSFFQPVTTEKEDDEETIPTPEVRPTDPLSPVMMLANKYPDEFIERNRYALRNITINRADGSQITGDLVRYLRTGDPEANPIMQEGDIIHINRFHDYNPRVSISGAVGRPLELEYRPDDTIDRLIRMAGGTTYDAAENYVKVVRLTEQGLGEEILDDASAINLYNIRPNDRLIIPYDREKRASQNVQVFGEARYTGRFPVEDGITTLYELLQLTGGLTDRALPRAAYLIRSEPGKTEFGSIRDTLMTTREMRMQLPNNMFGSRPSFDPDLLKRTSDQYEQGFEYLELEANLIGNRVSIDLEDDELLKSIKLFDGDRLHIPKNDGTIFLFGQVNQPGFYNFEPERTIEEYIERAGSFALSADEERIFIIKAQTGSWHRPGSAVLDPGDLVFVDRIPFDDLQASREHELRMSAQRNSNIQLVMTGLSAIAGVLTAYVAITR